MNLPLLLKQCQLSRSAQPSISVYYCNPPQNQFVTTLSAPIVIKPKLSLISSYIYLPRGQGNNLKIIILGFLEVCLDRTHTSVLNRLKEFVYDDTAKFTYLPLGELPERLRPNYNDEHIKKVLMEFFNLMTSHPYPTAHLYHFIQTYPVVLFLLELVFKKILSELGVNGAQIWRYESSTPHMLQSLAKYFDCLLEKAEDNVYWIARKVVFYQDKTGIYKNNFNQQGSAQLLVSLEAGESQDINDSRIKEDGLVKAQNRLDKSQEIYAWGKVLPNNSRIGTGQHSITLSQGEMAAKPFIKKPSGEIMFNFNLN